MLLCHVSTVAWRGQTDVIFSAFLDVNRQLLSLVVFQNPEIIFKSVYLQNIWAGSFPRGAQTLLKRGDFSSFLICTFCH